MQDLLSLTLAGEKPVISQGRNQHLSWLWRDEGIIELTPLHPSTNMALVVSCGIHGNETAPIEMVNQIASELIAGDLPLAMRLLIIIGNPAAMRENKRYLQADVNRMFGGRWQQFPDSAEARRALCLEQAIETFYLSGSHEELRWHLDLHTAIRGSWHTRFGVLPQRDKPWPQAFLRWLSAAGLEALVFHRAPGGTYTHFSHHCFQANSCTLELGKALAFGHNDLSQFSDADAALRALIYGQEVGADASIPRRYRVLQQITRLSAQFRLHMSKDTLNFTVFPQGTLLAEDGETRYYVQQAREYVLFPNPDVACGLRAGLMLVEDNAHNQALQLEPVDERQQAAS